MKLKLIILAIGWGVLIASHITFLCIFFTAFFNGGETLVAINDYHEANLEFAVAILTIPLVGYMVTQLVKWAASLEYK